MFDRETQIAAEVAAVYDLGCKSYGSTWTAPHCWLEPERAEVLRLISRGASLLDVGCGPGHDSAYWERHGVKATGIDISGEMIRQALRLHPHLMFEQRNFLEMGTFPKFDCLWMSYVLLHFPISVISAVVEKASELLSPAGIWFLSTSVSEKEATTGGKSEIAGLLDDQGTPLQVYAVSWNLDELRAAIGKGFREIWHRVWTPLRDRPTSYSGIWQRL